jgi:hypothetical protein
MPHGVEMVAILCAGRGDPAAGAHHRGLEIVGGYSPPYRDFDQEERHRLGR